VQPFFVGKRGRRRGGSSVMKLNNTTKNGEAVGDAKATADV
jgi:hypothetical protein